MTLSGERCTLGNARNIVRRCFMIIGLLFCTELCRDKTLLVIAHRLKTIRDADQILVIADGRIKESGTHDSLMAANGTYAHLVELQAS